jgi:ABC-type multidrug transport system ATPase subunit
MRAMEETTAQPGATRPILEVRGLTKRYGSVEALSGLDLSVAPGEVYGFLGRNGAGKSTTIRILMGITERTAGTIQLFGETASGGARSGAAMVRARQKIGYVAQEQNFYGWMTPKNLASFVRAFFPTWDDAEFVRLVRRLELPIDRKIGTFSGGMRVKVALATALAHRPPLLLLDEPTAGLDPVARREFLEIVRDESKNSGRTTFFSSHLVDEVELVAHRVGIVDGGRMRFEGGVRELGQRVRLVTRVLEEGDRPEAAAAWLSDNGFRVLHVEVLDGTARLFVESNEPERLDALAGEPELGFAVSQLPLEEIFIAMVRRGAGVPPSAPRAPTPEAPTVP